MNENRDQRQIAFLIVIIIIKEARKKNKEKFKAEESSYTYNHLISITQAENYNSQQLLHIHHDIKLMRLKKDHLD